jgi:acetoin utilization deacetylase AcuC-like enzyme
LWLRYPEMASAPVYLGHRSSLEHDTGPHPEQPARITAIEHELEGRDWLGYERRESRPVEREVLEKVHPRSYIDSIAAAAAAGGAHLDPDTVVSEGSFDAALHAAGGAVEMVDLLLDGAAPYVFSCHRPPGHHALAARAMGFCLFNNVAVAAQHALDARGLDRVVIFDWDVHHGNGTADIFAPRADVLYISIHQWPLYPGTGAANDYGAEPARGYTVNVPVPAGTGDDVYVSLVQHLVVPLLRAFAPHLLLISAGFDPHRDDPLAGCAVTEAGFAAMTASLRQPAAELGIPLGVVLEGGYALGPLARSVGATLEALISSQAPEPVEVAEEAASARRLQAQFWPELR